MPDINLLERWHYLLSVVWNRRQTQKIPSPPLCRPTWCMYQVYAAKWINMRCFCSLVSEALLASGGKKVPVCFGKCYEGTCQLLLFSQWYAHFLFVAHHLLQASSHYPIQYNAMGNLIWLLAQPFIFLRFKINKCCAYHRENTVVRLSLRNNFLWRRPSTWNEVITHALSNTNLLWHTPLMSRAKCNPAWVTQPLWWV